MSKLKQSISYCLNLVKKHDYDHYLCTLLLPKPAQPAVLALRSYNIELSLISQSITEKTIGQMRYQFWKNTIDNIYNDSSLPVPDHPVAISLAQAIRTYNLNKRWIKQLLEARESDLDLWMFFTTTDMELYAERTHSTLLYLTLQILGITDVNSDHAASHIGKAEAIVTILRATNYHRSRKHVLIPLDILARHSASQQDFLRGSKSEAITNSVYDFASLADAHLKKAKSLSKSLPPLAVRAFLPAVHCRSFLNSLQSAGFDAFHQKLTVRDSLLPVKLLWNYWKKLY